MTFVGTLAKTCRSAVSSLGRELAAWKSTRDRGLFGVQAMLSVALSVAVAHALDLSYTWWAAISGFAVMQTSFSGSVQRGSQRIAGTLIGAVIGAIAGPLIGVRPWLFVPMLGALAGIAAYYGNGSRSPYTWALGSVTALMVTYEAHVLLSFRSTAVFAAERLAEVVVGTLACVLVASVFHYASAWYRKTPSTSSTPLPPSQPQPLRETRLLLCLQGALSVMVLAVLAYYLHLPGFAQALVTAIAVLLLPAGLSQEDSRHSIIEKMVHRAAGCLLAGMLGVVLLPLLQGQAVLCLIALSMGVWVGCHVLTGRAGASYIGRQFTIAFIMVFVQDHRWSADPVPALLRLSGILAGIVIVTGVIFATRKVAFAPSSDDALSR